MKSGTVYISSLAYVMSGTCWLDIYRQVCKRRFEDLEWKEHLKAKARSVVGGAGSACRLYLGAQEWDCFIHAHTVVSCLRPVLSTSFLISSVNTQVIIRWELILSLKEIFKLGIWNWVQSEVSSESQMWTLWWDNESNPQSKWHLTKMTLVPWHPGFHLTCAFKENLLI